MSKQDVTPEQALRDYHRKPVRQDVPPPIACGVIDPPRPAPEFPRSGDAYLPATERPSVVHSQTFWDVVERREIKKIVEPAECIGGEETRGAPEDESKP